MPPHECIAGWLLVTASTAQGLLQAFRARGCSGSFVLQLLFGAVHPCASLHLSASLPGFAADHLIAVQVVHMTAALLGSAVAAHAASCGLLGLRVFILAAGCEVPRVSASFGW